MSLLDNVLDSAVPGGNLAKPLGIALLALLASRAAGNSGGAGTGAVVFLAVFSAAGWEDFSGASPVLDRATHRYRRIRLIPR
jgi:hypothetical protein